MPARFFALALFLLCAVSAGAFDPSGLTHWLRIGLYNIGFPTIFEITPSGGFVEIFDPHSKQAVFSGSAGMVTIQAGAGNQTVLVDHKTILTATHPLIFSPVGRPPNHLTLRSPRSLKSNSPTAASKGAKSVPGGRASVPKPGGFSRSYRGSIAIAPWKNRLFAVNLVELEEYLRSVVPAEIGDDAPPAALEAQAIAARTYAIRNFPRHSGGGFNLCDQVHCQVYAGLGREAQTSTRGVMNTAGQILLYGGKAANTVYHANCGGRLSDSRSVWGGAPVPYLPTHPDGLPGKVPFCQISVERPRPPKKGGTASATNPVPARKFVRRIHPGRGHRVGMCQDGAIGMAHLGFTAREILSFYYPQTALTRIGGPIPQSFTPRQPPAIAKKSVDVPSRKAAAPSGIVLARNPSRPIGRAEKSYGPIAVKASSEPQFRKWFWSPLETGTSKGVFGSERKKGKKLLSAEKPKKKKKKSRKAKA